MEKRVETCVICIETITLTADLWLDISHFQQLIVSADQAGSAPLELLTEAIDLYHDDFLRGFTLPDCPAFDEWQFFQSENLRQLFGVALEKLITMLRHQEKIKTALPHALRWLALDPLHEPAHRQLMELYALSGQQATALRQYQLCVETLESELGLPPSEETTALYQRIRRGRPYQVVEPDPKLSPLDETVRKIGSKVGVDRQQPALPRHNLPAQITPFIGREIELAELAVLLAGADERLVTIVGSGGMGKTRLALAAAEASLATDHFPHGVYFVSLAPLNEVGHIISAIAEVVGCVIEAEGQVGQSTSAQLLSYLRKRALLLVLDNFEHLLDGATLVADILQTASQVQILATSRERLHLRGEQLFPVRGLSFPDWETSGRRSIDTAVQLFIQSARRVRPHFEPTDDDLTALTRICRLVEGMPLGIELAAGWVELLSLAEIGVEIQRSLDFLVTEARNVPDRQRSMRAVFDSSWQRMSEGEQQRFAQFSVFRGGFTRPAAEAVTGASLRLLSALVNKSLLQFEPATGRYQIHELLRQYAGEKLAAAGQTTQARDLHAAYFVGFLQQQEAALKGQGHRQAKAAIAADFENVRLAWLWVVERRDYSTLERAIESLYWFLHQDLQRYQAGQQLFQTGRERLTPTEGEMPHPVWGKLLARVLPYGSGEFESPAQVEPWVEQALQIAAAANDEGEMAFCHWTLGRVRMILGDLTQAKDNLEHGLRYYRQVGDKFYLAWTFNMLAKIHNRQGQNRQMVDYYQQALGLHTELAISEVHILFDLGLAFGLRVGDYQAAEAHLRTAYQISQADDSPSNMAGALIYLSRVLAAKGDFEAAQSAALESLAIAEANSLEYRGLQARMDLGLRAYERGDFEQALAYLSQVQARSTTMGNQLRVETTMGLTMFQLGQAEKSWAFLANRLRGPVTLAGHNLPLGALLFNESGDPERAVSLLALFSTLHTGDLSGLVGPRIASEIGSIRERLAAALAQDRFEAAWDRGQQLDLATTLRELAEALAQ
jgi:predicted ATPase